MIEPFLFYFFLALPNIILLMIAVFIFRDMRKFQTLQSELMTRTIINEPNRLQPKKAEADHLKIQAYERLILFLERIRPAQLLHRVSPSQKTNRQFYTQLLQNIREEFEHNLSQQLYVSEDSWSKLKIAKESFIQNINQQFAELGPDEAAETLFKAILTDSFNNEKNPIDRAVSGLKKEFRTYFS